VVGDRGRAVHGPARGSRALVDLRLEQLLENPHEQPASAYDERTDQWATVYGDGAGLIVDAIVHEPQRLIVPRLI
jgi:hypothetical protein